MTKKQKNVFIRIVTAAALMIMLHFAPVSGLPRFALYLVPYLVIGYDILRKAVQGIFHGEIFDENFLMATATVGAMLLGIYNESAGREGEFAEGVAVMLFYQIGELFQSVAVGRSRKNISALMDIRPDYANIEGEDGKLIQVDPDDVEVGTIIVVQPGEKIPIDGIVAEGSSTLNTADLTGESVPREVETGGDVISGCVNISGLLKVRTTREFGESTVSKILDLVENSSMKKARAENFITRFAKYYTPAVCCGALALALLPPLVSLALAYPPAWSVWIIRALTFLVISCPCALVISIPLSFFGGIGGASSCGILVKGSNYLEALARTKYVVFDKTGTLTKGVFQVTEICPDAKWQENVAGEGSPKELLLKYAACAESYSNHPISKSLKEAYERMNSAQAADGRAQNGRTMAVQAADGQAQDGRTMAVQAADGRAQDGRAMAVQAADGREAGLRAQAEDRATDSREADGVRVTDVEEISGHGVIASVGGVRVAAGNGRLMKKLDLSCEEVEMPGTVVHLAVDGVYAGYILIADVVKEESGAAIAALKAAGVKQTVMLTGDRKKAAEHVAGQLGLDRVESELLPDDKVKTVEALLAEKSAGENLAFVGDGINDAPVLSRADIGVAMGALGSDAAIEAADIVLMDDNPMKLALAMRLSRRCQRIVYENIVFALAVKAACLVLGALGMASMWVAIFADVGVMVLAVLNAIRCLQVRSAKA